MSDTAPVLYPTAVLQVGQSTLADQVVLRNINQCREEPDLDCSEHLSAGGHRQEKARHPMPALHFFTDSGGQFIREKAHFIAGC